MPDGPPPVPQWSADGQWWWDGLAWVHRSHLQSPPLQQPVARRSRRQRGLGSSLATLVVVAAVAGGGWWMYFHPSPLNPPSTSDSPNEATVNSWDTGVDEIDAIQHHLEIFDSPCGKGSGFYISPSLLLTASHVLSCQNAGVTIHGPRGNVSAGIAKQDPGYDASELNTTSASTSAASIFSLFNGRPARGQQVWELCAQGVGGPQAVYEATVVSPSGPVEETDDSGNVEYNVPDVIQLTGGAHPGCSGGPLVDGADQVLGMIVAGNSSGAVAAISSEDLRAWLG